MAQHIHMRERRFRDEMLICERCGVSFLWTVEEQKRAEADQAPVHCPGCRHLLPPPGWERGVVKWYNARKKYGFIARQKGPELFAHRSRFAAPCRLAPGDLVEFRVEEGDQGPMAVDLRLLVRAREMETLPYPERDPLPPTAPTKRRKRSS